MRSGQCTGDAATNAAWDKVLTWVLEDETKHAAWVRHLELCREAALESKVTGPGLIAAQALGMALERLK